MAAAKAIGATAIRYPQPAEFEAAERDAFASGTRCGMRVGIIAREDNEEAWRVARERFPEDRRGQIAHKVAMKVSDSVGTSSSQRSRNNLAADDSPYWLGPMQNYKTFCPISSAATPCRRRTRRYISLGFRTVILDIPPDRNELEHMMEVFRRALQPGGVLKPAS